MARIKIRMCRLLRCCLFALAVICGVSSSQGASWKLHPSFDNNPLRIIDSERYTYFVVHQQPFDKERDRFSKPSLTVFIADRESPESGIVPLCRVASITPGQIRRVDYFPRHRMLGISYSDGLIELVGNDLSVLRVNRLVSGDLPGMSIINSLTPSPVSDDIFAATDAGWLKIDSRTGSTGEFVYSGLRMRAVTHVGGKILALTDNAVLQRNPQTQPSALAPIEGIQSPLLLLPVDESSFAYVAAGVDSAPALMLATMSDGEWNLRELCRDYFVSRPDNSAVTSLYEGNAVPNRDGYLLYSYNTMWQLRTTGDEEASVVSAPVPPDFSGVAGSWDFRDFWGYKDRGSFISRRLENSGGEYLWGEASAPLRPDAPVTFIARHMDYSERHGLLLVNMQSFHTGSYFMRVLPPLISGCLNGKWMNYSPAYTEPSAIAGNEELAQTYRSYRSWFPHADPAGITVDPLYPDYVWSGSIWGGMMMADVSDPSASPRRFGAENDLLSAFPGFQAIIPSQGWDTFSCISPVKSDKEGNLWALLFDYKGMREGSTTSSLLCFTKERRKAMMENGLRTGDTWEVMPLPYYKSLTMYSMLLPLDHPARTVHVLAHPSTCDGSILFIDHGGTPCEKGDDKVYEASVFRFPEGSERTLGYLSDFAEDPATGRVVVATDNGAFVIEPGTLPENGCLEVSNLCLSGAGGEEIIPPVTHVNRLLFDPYGRLWIGTANEGVVGVSKGFKEVVARFSRDNSPLPSDMVYGLGWNEAENSLLISTEGGLAEVVPGNEGVWISRGGVSIYPYAASPGYNGMVAVSNLPPDSTVEIIGPDGRRITSLANRHSTRVEWSLLDSEGNRVESGLYTIRISDGSEFSFPVLSGL